MSMSDVNEKENITLAEDDSEEAKRLRFVYEQYLEQEQSVQGLDREACKEVVANFTALLEDVDFAPELEIFNLKFYNAILRKKLIQDFKAIYIGLWAMALQTSFPQTCEAFFHYFMEGYLQQFKNLERKKMQDKVYAYREMVLRSDVRDFNHISQHLLSFVKHNEETHKANTLRLSLALRNHYAFIFQRLV